MLHPSHVGISSANTLFPLPSSQQPCQLLYQHTSPINHGANPRNKQYTPSALTITKMIIEVFMKHKILSVETTLNTPTHQHTGYTKLKMGSKQRLERDEDSSTEWKAWQVYSFGKITVFRLRLNESREGFISYSLTTNTCASCAVHASAALPSATAAAHQLWGFQ